MEDKVQDIVQSNKKSGRPKGSKNKQAKRWRITFLNPANKLPISIEEYSTVEEVAEKLSVTVGIVYEIHKKAKRRYEFTKVEKITN